MLTLMVSPRQCCDGVTRRETLKAGSLSALGGFGLSQMLSAEAAGTVQGAKAKNVIFIFLLGGAATQDMYDLKPDAPAEIRGEFKPIPTTVPGIEVCEHLPKLAQMAHQFAFIRSVNHKAGCHNCLPCYTGYDAMPPDQHPRGTDPPSMGSALQYLGGPRTETPQYVYMPNWLGWGQSFRRAGPYGGFLGKEYDPLTTECLPYYNKDSFAPSPGTPQIVRGAPVLPSTSLEDGMTIDRLNERRSLLLQIDDERRRADRLVSTTSYLRNQQQAFDILTSSGMRKAFDLSQEDPKTVDRYGQTLFGNSALIARRLVEAGVRFVNVTWDLFWGPVNVDYDAWDTHTNTFKILKKNKFPPAIRRREFEKITLAVKPGGPEGDTPPAIKKQFVIVLSDPDEKMPKHDFVGWVLQIPENESVATTQDRIFRSSYDYNTTKKGQLLPVKTVGEAIENVPAKFFKEAEVWVKTKTPVLVLKTNNEIPKE